MKQNAQKSIGFTLVELLVTTAVIGVLGAISIAAVGKVKQSAYKAADITAARQIVSGYLLYANDNKGRLIPAVPSQDFMNSNTVYDYNGVPILQRQAAERYVFRLLPYVEDLRCFYPGPAEQHLNQMIEKGDVYDISISPAFGLNREFIGGNYGVGRYTQEYFPVALTTLAQSPNPSNQIVVCSSFSEINPESISGAPYQGFFRVAPPNGLSTSWYGDQYSESSPENLGYIHLRYGDQAVVGNLDGSVQMLNQEELSDMRRWSYQAQLENNRNYAPRRR